MKVRVVRYTSPLVRDRDGNTHPGDPHTAQQALLSIVADDGTEGHCPSPVEVVRPHLVNGLIRHVATGQDPFARARIWQDLAHWQRGSTGQLSDRTLAIVELGVVGPGRTQIRGAGIQADRRLSRQGAGLATRRVATR